MPVVELAELIVEVMVIKSVEELIVIKPASVVLEAADPPPTIPPSNPVVVVVCVAIAAEPVPVDEMTPPGMMNNVPVAVETVPVTPVTVTVWLESANVTVAEAPTTPPTGTLWVTTVAEGELSERVATVVVEAAACEVVVVMGASTWPSLAVTRTCLGFKTDPKTKRAICRALFFLDLSMNSRNCSVSR